MRRYGIVFGLLLILSVTDFALAAPILAQEKPHVGVSRVPNPEDVITLLRKRGVDDDLAKLAEQYLNVEGKPIASSDAHASSSSSDSAPPESDHVSTDVAQAPPSDPASSSTDNPDSPMKATNPQVPWIQSNFDHSVPPWSDEDVGPESGYNSEEYVPQHWPNPNPNSNPYPVPFKFPSTHPWSSSSSVSPPPPLPESSVSGTVDAPAPNRVLLMDELAKSAGPPKWAQSSPLETFTPPWSDDETLGSESGYGSGFGE